MDSGAAQSLCLFLGWLCKLGQCGLLLQAAAGSAAEVLAKRPDSTRIPRARRQGLCSQ